MGIEVASIKGLKGGWGGMAAAKSCDSCKSAAAAIFCRADSAFMCLNCDSRIHKNVSSRHERVWMCEVCEQAPAAVTCKADAAALCVTCDADIHSANPLSQRHERVPVQPFFESADSIVKSSPFSFLLPAADVNWQQQEDDVVEPECSWLLPNTTDLNPKHAAVETYEAAKTGDLFFSSELDPFIDFEYQNSFQQHHNTASMDSVVPVQTKPIPIPMIGNENCFDVEFCRHKQLPTFSYQTQSLSHSVSSSSHEVGVVPDGNSLSEISYPFGQAMSAATTTNNQVGGLDREARVLRYREKRKNRKFEKTIRYASRKAYAESRPRIKGRFAKRRTEIDSEVDHIYNLASASASATAAAAFMSDTQYGVVPILLTADE